MQFPDSLFDHSHILDKSVLQTCLIDFVLYRHSWNDRTAAEAQGCCSYLSE